MRPFGNDITNLSANSNGSGGGNNDPNDGDDANQNNDRSTTTTITDNEESAHSDEDPTVPPHIARIGGIGTFPPIAGQGVIRVVHRCEDAKENHKLDLSNCELMQIPEAVYHLMRNTELQTCDLSGNVLKSVSPKFSQKFSHITDLNLSHNKLSRLPDEFAGLTALIKLNISNNSFIVLPQVVFKLQNLASLDAQNNAILEIDTEEAIASDCLALVDLRNNPLSRNCRRRLQNFKTSFVLEISVDVEDDW
ncbi:leucine-rich repeat-containing protein 20 isoform X1 [Drosophila elegans]|uniref:leucine-rich repeat-containing protein 20 isoform X1 n=1 Tax=Drosophila elegans TaxID=30023 RepID=UPI0007E7CDFA|nr:leucine-rich repeat-containing protein 20 isoform X1 [Drosophila elegans]